ERTVLAFHVVLDLLADELLAGLGQDARVAGLVRLHLDVVPAWSTLGPEIHAATRELRRGCEARIHLGILPDDDASHVLVVDLDALRPRENRARADEDPHDDGAPDHSWTPEGFRSCPGPPLRRQRHAAPQPAIGAAPYSTVPTLSMNVRPAAKGINARSA